MKNVGRLARLGTCPVLMGGRAPISWKNKIFLSTSWTSGMTNCCAWLSEISNIHVRLSTGPLFGACIKTLTDQIAPSSEREAEHTNSRTPIPKLTRTKDRSDHDQPVSPVETRNSFSDFLTHLNQPSRRNISPGISDSHELRKPLELNKEADRDLLKKLADDADPIVNSDIAGHRPEKKPSNLRDMTNARSMYEKHNTSRSQQRGSPAVTNVYQPLEQMSRSESNVSRLSLLYAAAKRARRFLKLRSTQDWRYRTNYKLVAPDKSALGVIFTLEDQWNSLLSGLPAPAHLLTRHWRDDNSLNVDGNDSEPDTRDMATGILQDRVQRETHDNVTKWEIPEIQYQKSGGSRACDEHPNLKTSAEVEVEFSAPIHPPVLNGSLPPLLTLNEVNGSSSKVITDKIRQDAPQNLGRQNKLLPDDDMDDLAHKIERILNDQARRHGIDV